MWAMKSLHYWSFSHIIKLSKKTCQHMRGYCNMIGASDLETRHSTSGGKRMTSQGRDSLSLSVITRLLTSFFECVWYCGCCCGCGLKKIVL
jgi:hypothetical protein